MQLKEHIAIFDAALPASICNDTIRYFENQEALGLTYPRDTSSIEQKDSQDFFYHVVERTERVDTGDKNFGFVTGLMAAFWHHYEQYASHYGALKHASPHTIAKIKFQKTKPCEGYHTWHFECGEKFNSGRLLFFIFYLNDVEEGGETEFLYQSLRVKPKQGTLVIAPASYTHTHRGNPPLVGTKYIVTGWVEFA